MMENNIYIAWRCPMWTEGQSAALTPRAWIPLWPLTKSVSKSIKVWMFYSRQQLSGNKWCKIQRPVKINWLKMLRHKEPMGSFLGAWSAGGLSFTKCSFDIDM